MNINSFKKNHRKFVQFLVQIFKHNRDTAVMFKYLNY